jgi:hypothetical protein
MFPEGTQRRQDAEAQRGNGFSFASSRPCVFASKIIPSFVGGEDSWGRKEFQREGAKTQRRKEESGIPLRHCVVASLRSIPLSADPLAKLYLTSRPFSSSRVPHRGISDCVEFRIS